MFFMANYATAAPVATSESALSPMDKPNEGKEIQPRKAGAINGTKSFTASSEEEKKAIKKKNFLFIAWKIHPEFVVTSIQSI